MNQITSIRQESEGLPAGGVNRSTWITTGLFAVVLLVCWGFPQVWYVQSIEGAGRHWFEEKSTIAGWRYEAIPVAKAAESVLVADSLVNGEFTNPSGAMVRVFSAKRLVEKPNEIGLFVHTPDRCWTESGWKMEPVLPDSVSITLHDVPLIFERRVFQAPNGIRELVYFGGLVGGQPLPYRLDHNMSVGMKHQLRQAADKTGTSLRAVDNRLWRRVWDSFANRRQLLGPKQFIRISAPLKPSDSIEAKDALLRTALAQWLEKKSY